MSKDLQRWVSVCIIDIIRCPNARKMLFLLFYIDHNKMCLLQKDVDLSKDDLLGDILQDLHSEVSVKPHSGHHYLKSHVAST